jgi:hypothetical protein
MKWGKPGCTYNGHLFGLQLSLGYSITFIPGHDEKEEVGNWG